MLRLSIILVCLSFCLGSFAGVKMTRDDSEHLAVLGAFSLIVHTGDEMGISDYHDLVREADE